jgi:hypothetical protein
MPKDKTNIAKLGRKYCTTIYSCHKAVISIQILQRGKHTNKNKSVYLYYEKQNSKKFNIQEKEAKIKTQKINNIVLLESFVIYEYP